MSYTSTKLEGLDFSSRSESTHTQRRNSSHKHKPDIHTFLAVKRRAPTRKTSVLDAHSVMGDNDQIPQKAVTARLATRALSGDDRPPVRRMNSREGMSVDDFIARVEQRKRLEEYYSTPDGAIGF